MYLYERKWICSKFFYRSPRRFWAEIFCRIIGFRNYCWRRTKRVSVATGQGTNRNNNDISIVFVVHNCCVTAYVKDGRTCVRYTTRIVVIIIIYFNGFQYNIHTRCYCSEGRELRLTACDTMCIGVRASF